MTRGGLNGIMNGSTPMAAQTMLLCVDAYRDRAVEGRLWCMGDGEASPFCNLMQLILSIETLLHTQSSPKNRTEQRCPDYPRPWAPGPAVPVRGTLETFRVSILFRQNMSWQGYVSWQGGRMEQSFRSALELMLLMDQVLTQAERMKCSQTG